jgi:probable F420-dependent oxidoreductase
MRFGFHLPNFGQQISPEAITKVAQRAEALEFDSVWVSDHIVIPKQYSGIFSENIYEPLTVLTYVAGVTKTIKLGTSVIIVPYRNPLHVAKAVATLDVLSKGRVIFGAGAGWMAEEFKALGVSFAERGKISDEYIRILKAVWTSAAPEFHGDYFNFSDLAFLPQPVQKPHPPIWVGGASPRSMRRAAELGNGWHPTRLTPEELTAALPHLKRLAERYGRRVEEIEISIRLRLQSDRMTGTVDHLTETIAKYQAAGAHHILLDPSFDFLPTDKLIEMMEKFAQEIRPSF